MDRSPSGASRLHTENARRGWTGEKEHRRNRSDMLRNREGLKTVSNSPRMGDTVTSTYSSLLMGDHIPLVCPCASWRTSSRTPARFRACNSCILSFLRRCHKMIQHVNSSRDGVLLERTLRVTPDVTLHFARYTSRICTPATVSAR